MSAGPGTGGAPWPDGDPLQGLDTITVTGIRGWGRHGVLPAETDLGQTFVVDVTVHLRTVSAGRRDDLAGTVNYAEVAAVAAEEIGAGPHALVETLAERIAHRVLTGPGAPRVRRAEVSVHKPAAPVGLPVDDVRVRIVRDATPVPAVLALGTNLGDRTAHLAAALVTLADAPGVEIAWTSPVVETAPVGGPEGQGAFLNAVVGVDTVLPPEGLLALCHRLEREARRVREVRWGPRTLDVDVVAYGDLLSADPELTLPHPRAHERAFVLDPWSRARPQAVLPGHGRVAALRDRSADRDQVRPGPAVDGFDRS